MRRRRKILSPPDRLKLSYKLLIDMIENPRRLNYIALIKKIKGTTKELIDIDLYDFKKEIDYEIRCITKEILRKIKY